MTQTESIHTSAQVCELANITYRQLDYWTRQRWVHTTRTSAPGSGTPRYFTESEVKRVVLMAKMVEAGVMPVDAHMLTLRGEYDDDGVFRARLYGHVYVEVFP
jgi:hypothetical protein